MKTIVSAVQPSNQLTLGNYLGALKNWVQLQNDYQCFFFAVDLHALTVRQDPRLFGEQTLTALATYLAAGINPKRASLFIQSHVPAHSELCWLLTCFAGMGELGRMTQFKDKTAKIKDNEGVGIGLFSYPILMAADILLYDADLVPVGDDQRQHLQLARDLAMRVNSYLQENIFKVPEPMVVEVGARVRSLQDPARKMSKSDPTPGSSIYLSDSDDEIRKKIKRAVTDSGEGITLSDDKLGVKNLLTIYAATTNTTLSATLQHFEGKRYGHLKAETAEAVVSVVAPIRTEVERILQHDRGGLSRTLADGAEEARIKAGITLDRVKDRMGLVTAF